MFVGDTPGVHNGHIWCSYRTPLMFIGISKVVFNLISKIVFLYKIFEVCSFEVNIPPYRPRFWRAFISGFQPLFQVAEPLDDYQFLLRNLSVKNTTIYSTFKEPPGLIGGTSVFRGTQVENYWFRWLWLPIHVLSRYIETNDGGIVK